MVIHGSGFGVFNACHLAYELGVETPKLNLLQAPVQNGRDKSIAAWDRSTDSVHRPEVDATAITQLPFACRVEAQSMPEGRESGRSAATSIDGAEHGATLCCVMASR